MSRCWRAHWERRNIIWQSGSCLLGVAVPLMRIHLVSKTRGKAQKRRLGQPVHRNIAMQRPMPGPSKGNGSAVSATPRYAGGELLPVGTEEGMTC